MAEKRSDKTTITDVARHAGVSTATAGRVLGGYGYTSAENKEKVRLAAQALGYRANQLARSLITGKTRTIGVVAGDIQSPFYASVLRGIADVARAQGFGVLLTNSDERLEREIEAVQLLLEKQIDGLIVAPCDTSGARHLHEAAASGCPIVQIDRRVAGLAADSVTLDNRHAARDSIGRLILAGHRRIGMIAELERFEYGDMEDFVDRVLAGSIDPETLFPSWQRLFGYIEAHLAHGITIDRSLIGRVGTYSGAAARAATMKLLQRADRPTALFTADGLMSAVAMDAITSLDFSLPDALSLICFDDLDWMRFLKPGITAIAQPMTEMGEAAARLILSRISGEDGAERHQVLTHTLALRGSVAPPHTSSA